MQFWTNFMLVSWICLGWFRMVQNGSKWIKWFKKAKKRFHCFQTMLKKSWLCLLLRTYAQILCLFSYFFTSLYHFMRCHISSLLGVLSTKPYSYTEVAHRGRLPSIKKMKTMLITAYVNSIGPLLIPYNTKFYFRIIFYYKIWYICKKEYT